MKLTLKSKVLRILEEFPKTRDSDVRLALVLWQVYYPQKIHKEDEKSAPYIYLRDVMDLPKQSDIGRIRQLIQYEDHRFLPTCIEVVKQRRLNEDFWRKHVENGQQIHAFS